MSWRVAESLDVLLDQINAYAPNRSTRSDGSIGDAAHRSRESDHNPWVQGHIVTARDFTHDPGNGFDAHDFADELRRARDPRTKYIISDRRIASDRQGWAWRYYSGANPHSSHVHVSVKPDEYLFDDTSPWPVLGSAGSTKPPHTGEDYFMAEITKDELREMFRQYNPVLDHEDFTNYMIWASRNSEVQNNLSDAAVSAFLAKEVACPDGETRTLLTILVWGYHRINQAAGAG